MARRATMARKKNGAAWPSWPHAQFITLSEWEGRWQPHDNIEEDFNELQGSATARRLLMNYFLFYPEEIEDWVVESDRTRWYLKTTGSLTLLHLRTKVEAYRTTSNVLRRDEDWTLKLFAPTWTHSVVEPRWSEDGLSPVVAGVALAVQSASEADDDAQPVEDDNLSDVDDGDAPMAEPEEINSPVAVPEGEVDPAKMKDDGSLVEELGQHDELGDMIAKRHKKARLLDEEAKKMKDEYGQVFDVGIRIDKSIRKAYLGDGGSDGGNGNSDNSNGALNPVQAGAVADQVLVAETDNDATLANKLAGRAITLGLAIVEVGNAVPWEVQTAASTAAAVNGSAAASSSAVSTAADASSAASTAASTSTVTNRKMPMPHAQAWAIESNLALGSKRLSTDSDDEDNDLKKGSWPVNDARVAYDRTKAALGGIGHHSDEPMYMSTMAMTALALDCSMSTLRVEPSDPNGDRSVVWLQTHHIAVNVESKSVWRLFLMEHGDPSFFAKEIFAGLGLLRPGASPMLLASAPVCHYKDVLSRNAKTGIPGDEIDLMLSDLLAQKRGHAMVSSVILGINEVVTLKPVGAHGYVVLTFLQCFTHDATFKQDEAWLLDNYPHLVSLLYKPAAIVMAHDGMEKRRLLLANVEDMAPGTKDQIFTKGKGVLLQKVNQFIKEEKQNRDKSSILFDHDACGRPIVSFEQLGKMRWASDVFKEESGYQGSGTASTKPAQFQDVLASQGSSRSAGARAGTTAQAHTQPTGPKNAAAPSTSAASSPTVASNFSKGSNASKPTLVVSAKAKKGGKPRRSQSLLATPSIVADTLDEGSIVSSLEEILVGSPTFDSEDIAGSIQRITTYAKKKSVELGAVAAFDYVKGRTSQLVNGTWKTKLVQMETKAHQALSLVELQTIEQRAQSYYEDLVSAMNVLNSLAQKYSETYEPKGKQAQTLDSLFAAIKRAVVAGKARHENKRNRSETPTPSALALMPPPQSAIPGELVQAITNIAQMAQLAQSAAEAKRPRTEDTDAGARVRELEKQIELSKATLAVEAKKNKEMDSLKSSFLAQMEAKTRELEQLKIENARNTAVVETKTVMDEELLKLRKAHFDSANEASCLKGAMMMQYAGLGAASGMMSQQGIGAEQAMAALLGFSKSAELPLRAPPSRFPQLDHKAPNESSPMPGKPPDVDRAVQKLMEDVQKAIKACLAAENYDAPADLKRGTIGINQMVEKIALLNAKLAEEVESQKFDACTVTKAEIDKAASQLEEQMNELRMKLNQLMF